MKLFGCLVYIFIDVDNVKFYHCELKTRGWSAHTYLTYLIGLYFINIQEDLTLIRCLLYYRSLVGSQHGQRSHCHHSTQHFLGTQTRYRIISYNIFYILNIFGTLEPLGDIYSNHLEFLSLILVFLNAVIAWSLLTRFHSGLLSKIYISSQIYTGNFNSINYTGFFNSVRI